MSDPHEAFVAAFNRRDVQGLIELMSPDATAEVMGSGFPVEEGREEIGRVSLPHVLDPEAGLRASKADAWVLLCTAGGVLDTAVHLEVDDGAIRRIEYVVVPHQPERLRAIGRACGRPTVADDAS